MYRLIEKYLDKNYNLKLASSKTYSLIDNDDIQHKFSKVGDEIAVIFNLTEEDCTEFFNKWCNSKVVDLNNKMIDLQYKMFIERMYG